MTTKEQLKEFFDEIFDEDETQEKSKSSYSRKLIIALGRYFACVVLSTAILFCYILMGHNQGWPRAQQWHHNLVKHHILPDRNN